MECLSVFQCIFCTRYFNNFDYFKRHIIRHTKSRSYSKRKMNGWNTTLSRNKVVRGHHLKKHLQDIKQPCRDQVNKIQQFSSYYECKFCKTTTLFAKRESFETHTRNIQCTTCGGHFGCKNVLALHMDSSHTCYICRRIFLKCKYKVQIGDRYAHSFCLSARSLRKALHTRECQKFVSCICQHHLAQQLCKFCREIVTCRQYQLHKVIKKCLFCKEERSQCLIEHHVKSDHLCTFCKRLFTRTALQHHKTLYHKCPCCDKTYKYNDLIHSIFECTCCEPHKIFKKCQDLQDHVRKVADNFCQVCKKHVDPDDTHLCDAEISKYCPRVTFRKFCPKYGRHDYDEDTCSPTAGSNHVRVQRKYIGLRRATSLKDTFALTAGSDPVQSKYSSEYSKTSVKDTCTPIAGSDPVQSKYSSQYSKTSVKDTCAPIPGSDPVQSKYSSEYSKTSVNFTCAPIPGSDPVQSKYSSEYSKTSVKDTCAPIPGSDPVQSKYSSENSKTSVKDTCAPISGSDPVQSKYSRENSKTSVKDTCAPIPGSDPVQRKYSSKYSKTSVKDTCAPIPGSDPVQSKYSSKYSKTSVKDTCAPIPGSDPVQSKYNSEYSTTPLKDTCAPTAGSDRVRVPSKYSIENPATSVKEHVESDDVHPPGAHPCGFCKEYFLSINKLKIHKTNKHKICPFCNNIFKTDFLYQHLNQKFICTLCQDDSSEAKKFEMCSDLQNHLKSVHGAYVQF